ncbi:MAG: peptide chain release factor 2 [Planctomycetes bacterium]|nr:peptide chain release factor 2 [Planctomycetota bacterium]
MKEYLDRAAELGRRLTQIKDSLDYLNKQAERAEFEEKMAEAGFWDDQESAQKILGALKLARAVVEPCEAVDATLEEIATLGELGEEAGASEVEADLAVAVGVAEGQGEALEFQVMLGGENDHRSAYLTVQAGAGGVDAADFASMLLRLYLRWSERRGFGTEMVEVTEADEGGIRHATIHVKGPYAYGYLKAERGVHRLVRISPFDAQSRRHTAFAAIEAMPEFDADAPIEVDMDQVRVDTYRAGGAGGQHVNKTDSAVRMTHLPTGIVVQCQNERSQHKNRATATGMLKAKLYELRQRERDDELKRMYGEKGEIAWGSQIRSYVLNPYQMVKDHRTNFEKGNTQAVFDGDIDEFIEEYLRSRSSG